MLRDITGLDKVRLFAVTFFNSILSHTVITHQSYSYQCELVGFSLRQSQRQQLISCQDDIAFIGRVQVGVKPVTVLSSSFSCSPSPQGFGMMLSSWKCTNTCGEGPNLCSCSGRKYRMLQYLLHFSEGFFPPNSTLWCLYFHTH